MESTDFETLKFSPFNTSQNSILLDNLSDPDIQFFNKNNLQNFDTPYFNTDEVNTCLQTAENTDFSVLHVNIRSLSSNFDKLKNFLSQITHSFGMICITETWCTNDSFVNNSNFQLPNYLPVSFERTSNL